MKKLNLEQMYEYARSKMEEQLRLYILSRKSYETALQEIQNQLNTFWDCIIYLWECDMISYDDMIDYKDKILTYNTGIQNQLIEIECYK